MMNWWPFENCQRPSSGSEGGCSFVVVVVCTCLVVVVVLLKKPEFEVVLITDVVVVVVVIVTAVVVGVVVVVVGMVLVVVAMVDCGENTDVEDETHVEAHSQSSNEAHWQFLIAGANIAPSAHMSIGSSPSQQLK
mmetsp:Transcript_119256/g.230061  ORF Transcript_119256/g.230061 Transcript_119256/m.230061 type:complete len:135 (-) Transcript_119256:1545-1949(-)